MFFQNSRDLFLQPYLYRFLFAGIHVRPYNDDRVTRFAMLAAQWCLRQTRTPLCDSSGCSRDWPNEGPAKAISMASMDGNGGLSPVCPWSVPPPRITRGRLVRPRRPLMNILLQGPRVTRVYPYGPEGRWFSNRCPEGHRWAPPEGWRQPEADPPPAEISLRLRKKPDESG